MIQPRRGLDGMQRQRATRYIDKQRGLGSALLGSQRSVHEWHAQLKKWLLEDACETGRSIVEYSSDECEVPYSRVLEPMIAARRGCTSTLRFRLPARHIHRTVAALQAKLSSIGPLSPSSSSTFAPAALDEEAKLRPKDTMPFRQSATPAQLLETK